MGEFLDELAAPTPTPGGGAAAASVAAVSAALCEMVAGLGAVKGREGAGDVVAEAHALRVRLLSLGDADGPAFDQVMAAYRLPKDDPARPRAISAALRVAALSPLDMLDAMAELSSVLSRARGVCPKSAQSDLDGAFAFLKAAVEVAGRNVSVNLDGADGAEELRAMLDEKLGRLSSMDAQG